MIEMRWVKPKMINCLQPASEFEKSTLLGGHLYKLQYREVVERSKAGCVIIATDWQDVEISEEKA